MPVDNVLTDITSKSSNSFVCHICGKQFAHSSSLYRHKKMHPGSSSGSISCQDCLFTCRTLQELRDHLKCSHNKPMDEEVKEFVTFDGTSIACV